MIGRFTPITVLCLLIPLFSGCATASGRTPPDGDALLLGRPLPAKRAQLERPALDEPSWAATPADSVRVSREVTPAAVMDRRPHASREGSLHAEREAYDLRAAAPAGVHGHAADHSWLRGKIDRPYSGGIKLRFCDPAEQHHWGGCVFLTGEPALNGLREGSLVEVRGRLLPSAAPAGESIYSYPAYQVHGFSVLQAP